MEDKEATPRMQAEGTLYIEQGDMSLEGEQEAVINNEASIVVKEERAQEQPKKILSEEESVEIMERVTRELAEVDKRIFSKMSLASSHVLWPAVVLQPLVGERRDLEQILAKEKASE